MRNERVKRAESLEAVTHTHTHTHTPLFRFTEELVDSLERERELEFRKNRREKVQLSCACLGKKDGLRKLGCLFCACDSS